ncbi:uncharacterized protein LOC135833068 [Planococcus citri]|uniref:uncharacterized protein LOC135833068 n=1 Tax=Planococcus citri TaxID=170843 RepID=UPI0031F9BF83
MNGIALAITLTIACTVSVSADTSYTPPPANGGPYPTAKTTTTTPSSAPYPPSGWKPTGRKFELPARPRATYLPPTTTIADTESATTAEGATAKPEALEAETLNGFGSEQQPIPDNGLYYVLLPDGRLQKVSYTTMPITETVEKLRQVGNIAVSEVEKKSNGYVANVKYQDVEPINGPIYAYQNAPLVRIYK